MQLRAFLTEQEFFRISLQKLPTGHYKFKAKVNEFVGDFILDTGASTSCIGFHCADFFELKSEESDIKAAGAGAINMDTRLSKRNKLQVGSMVVGNISFVLFDLSHVNEALAQADIDPVHGIIGADFLKSHRAVIDYGRNCLYLK